MAFTDLIDANDARDVANDTCDLLSSATPMVLLKTIEEEMEALRQKQGLEFKQPHRPLGKESTIPKIAANYVMKKGQPTIGVFAGLRTSSVSVRKEGATWFSRFFR